MYIYIYIYILVIQGVRRILRQYNWFKVQYVHLYSIFVVFKLVIVRRNSCLM